MKSKDQILLEAAYQSVFSENYKFRKTESDPFKEAIQAVYDLTFYDMSPTDKQKIKEIMRELERISESPEAKSDKRSEHFFQRSSATGSAQRKQKEEMDSLIKQNQKSNQERFNRWNAGDASAGQLPNLK